MGGSPRHIPSLLAAALLFAIVSMTAPAAAQNRALIIGVGTYSDSRLAALPKGSSAVDIASIEKVLTKKLGFKKEEIKILRDAQATRTAILDAIADWLRPDRKELEERKKDQKAIRAGKVSKKKIRALRRKWAKAARRPKHSYLYFAGYGFFQADADGDEADSHDEALVPHDARIFGQGRDINIAGLITDDDISAEIKTLEGRKVTVVLDTSHSGWARRAEGPTDDGQKVLSRAPVLADTDQSDDANLRGPEGSSDDKLVETVFKKGSLTVWSAVSPGQTAPLDSDAEGSPGLFTRAYSEGLAEGKADLNGNGAISNTELVRYLIDEYAAFCTRHGTACPAGLEPRLDPVRAYGRLAKRAKRRRRKLSVGLITDFLVEGGGEAVSISQEPSSPVRVGDTQLRFSLTAPHDGTLIMLSLTEKGQLIQLFPNQFVKSEQSGGRIAANVEVAVPDTNYGIQLTATDPAKGHVIALFTRDPVEFGSIVSARTIGDIPFSEALRDYLPALAVALLTPLEKSSNDKDRRLPEWSISKLPYEIVP